MLDGMPTGSHVGPASRFVNNARHEGAEYIAPLVWLVTQLEPSNCYARATLSAISRAEQTARKALTSDPFGTLFAPFGKSTGSQGVSHGRAQSRIRKQSRRKP